MQGTLGERGAERPRELLWREREREMNEMKEEKKIKGQLPWLPTPFLEDLIV